MHPGQIGVGVCRVTIERDSRDELPQLLSALADGTLSKADEERLANLLRTDQAARKKYYDHMMLAALLRREGRRAAAQDQAAASQDASLPVLPASQSAHPSPSSSALRYPRWLLVLAASLLMALAFTVSEATGVTRVVPTVIRIVQGEGTLVIEVDDPAVSVSLEGEDVTIKGAGIHELRLKPGSHKIRASRDGKEVQEDFVTIDRGGQRVIQVRREPTAKSNADSKVARALPGAANAETSVDSAAAKAAATDAAKLAARAKRDLEHAAQIRRVLTLTEELNKNPDDPAKLYQRADTLRRLGRYPEALVDCDRLVSLRPDWANSYEVRAHTLDGSGHADQAIRDYEKALELDPNHIASLRAFLWLSLIGNDPALRNPTAALPLAERRNRLEPNSYWAWRDLGVAYYRVGRYADAVAPLEHAARLSSSGPQAFDLYFLAMARHKLGQTEQARRDFDAAIAWHKTSPDLGNIAPIQLEWAEKEAESVLRAPATPATAESNENSRSSP
jgi:tetratricopeptide (TPR) repeat protein